MRNQRGQQDRTKIAPFLLLMDDAIATWPEQHQSKLSRTERLRPLTPIAIKDWSTKSLEE